MKLVVLAVFALAAVALAAPVEQEQVPIVRSEFDQSPNGGYVYSFETGDGVKKDEEGEVKTLTDEENKPQEVIVVRGSYSWVDRDGKSHLVTYVADENGFQPQSEDLPQTHLA